MKFSGSGGQPGAEWHMFAGRRGEGFCNFGNRRYVEMCGRQPVPVVLTENPEGSYWGFIYTDRPDRGPVMIQPSRSLFRVQFPYGPEEAVKDGRTVRLDCRAIDEPRA